MWALAMAFEHEKIHLETSSVLFRETPIHLMQVPKGWPALHPSAKVSRGNTNPQPGADFPENKMLPVEGKEVVLGKPRDFPSYGWDNEYGYRSVTVASFSASKYMITNGEFWHFVKSGGYRAETYWTPEGWHWRKHRNMKWPFFWEQDGPAGSMQFKLRTIFEVTDMQWDWPVDVNYHESKAYCAWKAEQDGLAGKPEAYRVITEAEHHLIRDASVQHAQARSDPQNDRTMRVGGEHFADASMGPGAANVNLQWGSQCPVDALPPSTSGHHDTMGNAWEWTEDHFNPLEGFEVHHVYDDFSAPCFDGRHHMIMGGSFASMGDNGGSIFCRYHFRPHFLQHSGFRLVSSPEPAPAKKLEVSVPDADAPKETAAAVGKDVYETSMLVDQYLGLHYPDSGASDGVPAILSHENTPDHALAFPQRVARKLKSLEPSFTNGRVLDLGCAVGGSSFELSALGFKEVVGIDFSEAFIDVAERMRQGEKLNFKVPVEGDITRELLAELPANIDGDARARVSFQVGDACRLPKDLGKFDGAVLANLLCRLPEPLACLDGLSAAINQGGIALIVTPFSWKDEFTHRSKWLGGFPDPVSGEPISSKETLRVEMEKRGFVKVHEEQMPLIIREHQRKYQYIVSEATAWRKM
jgi:5-histidylcysteine sulfoxide synthase/putative 4-mercaptohistidine N1-methyltranferase